MAPDRRPDGGNFSGTEESERYASATKITTRTVLSAMTGGLVGLVLMIPILIGIPQLFGIFQVDPILDFARLGMTIGLEPSLVIGSLLFGAGGAVGLPLLFVVAGAFLPPVRPRFVRGITFATIIWTGFVLAFWPGGTRVTIALFLFLSLLAHWIYGAVLGATVESVAGIPQHDV